MALQIYLSYWSKPFVGLFLESEKFKKVLLKLTFFEKKRRENFAVSLQALDKTYLFKI